MIQQKQDILDKMLSSRLLRAQDLTIACDNVRAVFGRDLVELYLYVSRVRRWDWIDARGINSPRQTFPAILYKVLRDALSWPFIYAFRSFEVRKLLAGTWGPAPSSTLASALFLRTDHWFNITSGGSVGHLSGVIHGLRSLGLTTQVVSTDRLVGIEADDQFHLCEPRYELGRNIPNIPELLFNDQLRKYIDERWTAWSPSFIYQRYSLGCYAGALLKARHRVPFVLEYNGSFPWVARNWEKRKLFHEKLLTDIELLNLRAADLIVVVSEALMNELMGRGIPEERILVNPNGVDPERYSPEVDGSAVRRKHGLAGKTVIGFIGTFGKWHGAEVLAEAFGRLLQSHPAYRASVRLLMIGDGGTMPQVKDALARYAVADACILAGRVPQEDGPAHLAACDILVSPHVPNSDGTPFFGSPTKLFEYMAMGKGIVASDLEQIGEILRHQKTAWMVNPGDAESLSAGLGVLLDDKELRDRLGKAAREAVVVNYTWKEHTRKIVEKLREHMNDGIGLAD